MKQRQGPQIHRMLGHIPFQNIGHGVDGGTAMVVNHAFGVAGGTGSVVQRNGVPFIGRPSPVVQIGGGGEEMLVFIVAVMGGIGRAEQVVYLDDFQLRHAGFDARNVVGKFAVHQQYFGFAVLQAENQPFHIQADIECAQYAARHGYAEMRFHHGRGVGQQHRHGVVAANADLAQGGGHLAAALPGFCPCLTHIAVHNGGFAAIHFGRTFEVVDGGERGVVGAVALQTGVEIGHFFSLAVGFY